MRSASSGRHSGRERIPFVRGFSARGLTRRTLCGGPAFHTLIPRLGHCLDQLNPRAKQTLRLKYDRQLINERIGGALGRVEAVYRTSDTKEPDSLEDVFGESAGKDSGVTYERSGYRKAESER
jgi:hypothetical protein